MVFFHGYLSSKEAFLCQIDYFSQFYKVTAFDFLGFGASSPLQEPFSVSDYAGWTKEVFSLLGIKRPHIIAHSFGVRVAVKMAKENGQVFDKMLLTGPAGIIVNRGFSYRMKVKTYRFVKKFFPRFAEKKFGSKEFRSLSPVMKESYKKIVNEDLRDDAERVTNEVLIVQGDHDRTTTLCEAEIYLSKLQKG
ncbi:MAG: alpha/beta hydrolase, partial [Clostridia bacterium]|nr:alpha/beta hydrolase [Clostridia bacterium]